MNVQMSTVTASAGSGSSDASLKSRIQALLKQITTLSKQQQEVVHSELPAKDKQKQSELLQARIEAVQAQLAELYRQQAEQAQRRQAQGRGDGQARVPGTEGAAAAARPGSSTATSSLIAVA
ncbi:MULTISPECIES: FlxA-like family protein [unclassified Rubrivivax]|uniref:FlxA-like family protein n=1 Tax=unclassified Rubrivivax TaxID=2649762 RepID=UPI001E58CDB7|nr:MULTISPECIES: FlxA-like family protein [unclassified Rubrivivax]MCC9597883.1 FlxA-like family protein [Rubrivivax sp. JA1055]MCC9645860.1 FlxA-like family protein [Rubrivivax sp. JA1029]MCD0417958.1 FlxA-like family protein [Rubrivivax sp. JA1024]